jgi:hypothetical protein
MEMRYQFFENEYLLIQKFTGLFSFEFYKKIIGQMHLAHGNKNVKKVLIDFRELKFGESGNYLPDDFDEKLEKIIRFRKEINKNELRNKEVNLVIWVDKPLPTVIAHLFLDSFSKMRYNYCSTEDKVIEILDLRPEFNLLNNINNLENSFTDG